MKLYMEESRRYVIDHGRKNERCTVREFAAAIDRMPNGWLVADIDHRDDGTTVMVVTVPKRVEVTE